MLCVHFLPYNTALLEHVSGNMKSSTGWCTHWALVFFSGDAAKIREFKEQHSAAVIFAELHPRPNSGSAFLAKPLMYLSLRPLLAQHRYDHVWLLDADLSLRGFRFADYLALVRCVGALVAQPVVAGHDQSMPALNEDFWTDHLPGEWPDGFLYDLKRGRPLAARYRFVEQQAPLFDGRFLEHFIDQVVAPLAPAYEALSETDWGLDDVWCGAARDFARTADSEPSLRCGIVMATPVQHLGARALNSSGIALKHSHSLASHWRFHFTGFLMRVLIRNTFPRWYDGDIFTAALRSENHTTFADNKAYSVVYKDQCRG